MRKKKILAIDPGKDKCGIAILNYDFNIVYQNIVPTKEIELYLAELLNNNKIKEIIIGDGTFSAEIRRKISELFNISYKIVDEAYTTEKAEERYRKQHYNKGWRKLLSFIKWKPARPVDDYSAIIMAEKYLKGQK